MRFLQIRVTFSKRPVFINAHPQLLQILVTLPMGASESGRGTNELALTLAKGYIMQFFVK